MAVIHDDECRVGELLHATPLRPGEYIWGKFLAVLAQRADRAGDPPRGDDRLQPRPARGRRARSSAGRSTWPTTSGRRSCSACRRSSSSRASRSPSASGRGGRSSSSSCRSPCFLGCVFFLWDWAPSWLDPRVDQALMLIDPAGFRWLNETWLKVDRGVTFYNTAPIPLDGLIVANRLIVAGDLGLGAVALSQRHFAATLRGTARRAERAWAGRGTPGPRTGEASRRWTRRSRPAPRPLAALGMSARPPGLFAGAWAVARAELDRALVEPGPLPVHPAPGAGGDRAEPDRRRPLRHAAPADLGHVRRADAQPADR